MSKSQTLGAFPQVSGFMNRKRSVRSIGGDEQPGSRTCAWVIVGVGRTDVVTYAHSLCTGVIAASYYTIETSLILYQEGIVATAHHLGLEVVGVGLVAECTNHNIVVLQESGITTIHHRNLLLAVTGLGKNYMLNFSLLKLIHYHNLFFCSMDKNICYKHFHIPLLNN